MACSASSQSRAMGKFYNDRPISIRSKPKCFTNGKQSHLYSHERNNGCAIIATSQVSSGSREFGFPPAPRRSSRARTNQEDAQKQKTIEEKANHWPPEPGLPRRALETRPSSFAEPRRSVRNGCSSLTVALAIRNSCSNSRSGSKQQLRPALEPRHIYSKR